MKSEIFCYSQSSRRPFSANNYLGWASETTFWIFGVNFCWLLKIGVFTRWGPLWVTCCEVGDFWGFDFDGDWMRLGQSDWLKGDCRKQTAGGWSATDWDKELGGRWIKLEGFLMFCEDGVVTVGMANVILGYCIEGLCCCWCCWGWGIALEEEILLFMCVHTAEWSAQCNFWHSVLQ